MAQRAESPQCRFLELPAELRLEVYAYVCHHSALHDHIAEAKSCCVRLAITDRVYLENTDKDCAYHTGIALMLTCKTVYIEARPILDANAMYRLDIETGPSRIMHKRSAVDLGPIDACKVLDGIRRAKVRFLRHEISHMTHASRLAKVLEATNHFEVLDYLNIDLTASDTTPAVFELLETIECAGQIEIRADRWSTFACRCWESIEKTAHKIGA